MQVHKMKFHKIDFDRQRVIGNYIVDFYVKALGLVIEIDGECHNLKDDYDQLPDEFFRSLGIKVWRISARTIESDVEGVMSQLEEFIVKEFGRKD
jgi:very-short-patch-repair endonuclease